MQLLSDRSAPQEPSEKSVGEDAERGTERSSPNLCSSGSRGHTSRAKHPPEPEGRLTWNPGSEEVKKLPIFGVHDRSLYELHHGLAAVFKLGMAPQAEGPFQEKRKGFRLWEDGWQEETWSHEFDVLNEKVNAPGEC